MKKLTWLLLILVSSAVCYAQEIYDVQDFSEGYYGKVYLENPSEVFSKGWVAIYDKKTNVQLIKVVSEELVSHNADGKIKANIKEIPYGEQSVVIYEDFNFDGVEDFAIMDGQNSCYHGPSFKIFLAVKDRRKFVPNQSFTRLAQEYCGMFDVDAKQKKISTMTKSGCCWHQYSEFIVVNNAPKAIKIVEEDGMLAYPFIYLDTKKWNGKRMVETSIRTVLWEDESIKILFSFKTVNNKQLILFRQDNELNYAFINKSGNIDFIYPRDSGQVFPMFMLDLKKDSNELSFINKNAIYRIYETANKKIGIKVIINGKSSDISGDANSQKGNLSKLIDEKLSNLTFNND